MFHADGHFWFQDFVSSACDEEHRLVDLFAFESVIMSASASTADACILDGLLELIFEVRFPSTIPIH